MDFASYFTARLTALKSEGNYRVFADLEKRCGCFPKAERHRENHRHARQMLFPHHRCLRLST